MRMRVVVLSILTLMFVSVHSVPSTAYDDVQIDVTESFSRATKSYSSITINSGITANYKNSGGNFSIFSGRSVSLTYSLSSSASIQVGFYNSSSGTSTILYTGTEKTNTVSFTPTASVTGYFYIKNQSTGTITISSVTIDY